MAVKEFSATLVREKVTFIGDGAVFNDAASAAPAGADDSAKAAADGGKTPAADGGKTPAADGGKTIVRSNRLVLELDSNIGKKETVVIRTQTMASCLRFASRLMYSYFRGGLFLNRDHPFDWAQQWNAVVSSYDRLYRPTLWGSVHINGNAVFKTQNSPLVDVLEKCAMLKRDDYDAAMGVTESALRQLGVDMRISHETNIAAVFFDKGDAIRVGIIYRADDADSTFNFSARGGEREVRVVEAIRIASAFLDGIDLRFTSRRIQEKIRKREVPQVGPEANQQRKAYLRLLAVNKVITQFEELFDVRYRPEKPEFFRKG